MSPPPQSTLAPADIVGEALQYYAGRGVFRGYSRGAEKNGKTSFKLVWHRDRPFQLDFDANKDQLRFLLVLPNVPSDSDMYAAFKKYLKSRQSDALPEHRRIDKAKADVRPYNRGGNVSLSLKIKDGDYDYGTRRIIHLVNEIFMDFLFDGLYYEYMIENFDLDPDKE